MIRMAMLMTSMVGTFWTKAEPLSWAPQLSGAGRANGDVRKSQAEITRSHGSHVAGIIGAKGNNGLGISGINWTTSLMALNAPIMIICSQTIHC